MATWGNHIEVVQFLLVRGVDVNCADQFGDTPLHVAAVNGYVDLFALLRKHGADLQARNDLGQTPQDCRRSPGTPDVVVLHADGQSPYAVIMTHPATVRAFLFGQRIEFDRMWIPDRHDVEKLDLKAALDNSSDVEFKGERYLEAVRGYLPQYNREYAGFVKAGRKYLICNAGVLTSQRLPRDEFGFTGVVDGGCSFSRIVVDLAENVVIQINCNGM